MKLFERQFLPAIIRALHDQIQPVVRKLRKDGIEAAINSLDTVEINSKLAKPIQEIYKTVGLYFANKTIHDLRQDVKGREVKTRIVWDHRLARDVEITDDPTEHKAGFGFNEEFLQQILAFFHQYLLNKAILPISETTKNQILQVISEGMKQGWGADKIAMALESPELLLWRARLIVRTESNKAMNYGQRLGESASEWESNKIWIAANDHRTRHSHRQMDDVEIAFDERYLVPIYKSGKVRIQMGVDLMTGPGDVHASAGNVCNCRCTIAFKAQRDESGRLIRKPAAPVGSERIIGL